MATSVAEKCVTVAVTFQNILSRSDHSVGSVLSKEMANKGPNLESTQLRQRNVWVKEKGDEVQNV